MIFCGGHHVETIQMLGSLGEFVGAIAVVATLVYLAIQVRRSKEAMDANTQSLNESRKLAMAQAYQARAALAEEAVRENVHSDYWPPLAVKLNERGLDALSPEERRRLHYFHQAWALRPDNLHYQYQNGFLDQEYYESTFKALLRERAPHWQALRVVVPNRPSFRAEVDRILSESEAESEAESEENEK